MLRLVFLGFLIGLLFRLERASEYRHVVRPMRILLVTPFFNKHKTHAQILAGVSGEGGLGGTLPDGGSRFITAGMSAPPVAKTFIAIELKSREVERALVLGATQLRPGARDHPDF